MKDFKVDHTYFDWMMYSTNNGEFSVFSEIRFNRHLDFLSRHKIKDIAKDLYDDPFLDRIWYPYYVEWVMEI